MEATITPVTTLLSRRLGAGDLAATNTETAGGCGRDGMNDLDLLLEDAMHVAHELVQGPHQVARRRLMWIREIRPEVWKLVVHYYPITCDGLFTKEELYGKESKGKD